MGNMFKKAAPLPTEKPKAKGKQKEQLATPGLRNLAILDAVGKQIAAAIATIKSEVNTLSFAHFVGASGGATRPSSFEGVDGVATASLEVRKRSSASVLTADEVEVLTNAGLKVESKVVQPHLFAINPKYASDAALLERVEKALSKVAGLPEDFISQQDEVTKPVVTDALLDAAFKDGASEDVLRILTTMAVKPKLSTEYDMTNVLADAVEILQPTPRKAGKVQLRSVGK